MRIPRRQKSDGPTLVLPRIGTGSCHRRSLPDSNSNTPPRFRRNRATMSFDLHRINRFPDLGSHNVENAFASSSRAVCQNTASHGTTGHRRQRQNTHPPHQGNPFDQHAHGIVCRRVVNDESDNCHSWRGRFHNWCTLFGCKPHKPGVTVSRKSRRIFHSGKTFTARPSQHYAAGKN